MINCYEETLLKNRILPEEWQSQSSLDELSEFLQRNWEQRSVFYEDGELSSRQQFLAFTGQKGLRTNNYIGTIAFKGKQLNIFPKMFRSEKEDSDISELDTNHLLKNIAQWIEYCTKFDYPFISIKSALNEVSDLRDLFVTLYVRYVKTALDRGLFYRYEERTDDMQTVKGKIDFHDYISKKIPNGNANLFSCTYSNFEFDNLLNRIIKYTCKLLIAEASKENQKILRNILMKLNEVSDVRCSPSDCDSIRLSYLNGNYRVILSMCKMFLLNQTSTYAIDTNESFCFLFPTEILFEGFIGGYIQSVLGKKAKVKLQASDLSLISDVVYDGESYGKAFTLRHDILVDHKEKGLFILDTKYKMTSRFEGNLDLKKSISNDVSQGDLYQVREYAAKRGLQDAYLLYPLFRFEESEPSSPVLKGTIVVDEKEHEINVHIIRIPFIFEENEEHVKSNLKKAIDEIF